MYKSFLFVLLYYFDLKKIVLHPNTCYFCKLNLSFNALEKLYCAIFVVSIKKKNDKKHVFVKIMPIIVVRFCFQAYFLFESSNGSLFTIFESDMGYKILRKCAALSSSSSSKLQILSKSITYLFCASQSLSS